MLTSPELLATRINLANQCSMLEPPTQAPTTRAPSSQSPTTAMPSSSSPSTAPTSATPTLAGYTYSPTSVPTSVPTLAAGVFSINAVQFSINANITAVGDAAFVGNNLRLTTEGYMKQASAVYFNSKVFRI